jgi:glycosyltransferase involved in cell wall biosynthesis
MRTLHVIPYFAPAWRYGGPIQSVLRLCQALQRAGVELDVATINSDGSGDLDVPVNSQEMFEGVPVHYFRRWPRLSYGFSAPLARFLLDATRTFDLVHITSTFTFPSLAAGFAARRAKVPYIVSPRGSLQRWSLRHKSWKKRPYWFALERAHLEGAAAIHATADMERDAVLQVLPRARVFVVPNGMEPISDLGATNRLENRIVFLGRLHKKKGFDVLVPALARVAREMPEVETVVAGPDEDGEWARVERLVEASVPRPKLRYVGPVNGTDRFRLLAESTVFVLPSHSENFGMTVVEAMACGTPVVVSRNCPWEVIEREGAGLWVENTPDAVATALLRVLRNPSTAAGMGEAGRSIAAKFGWSSVGQSMAAEYARTVEAAGRGAGERRVPDGAG